MSISSNENLSYNHSKDVWHGNPPNRYVEVTNKREAAGGRKYKVHWRLYLSFGGDIVEQVGNLWQPNNPQDW